MSSTEMIHIDEDADPELDASIIAAQALGQDLIDSILSRSPSSEISSLLDADAPLWYQSDDGTSALHAATYVDDAELVKTLLQKGSTWNAMDLMGNTAGDIALSLNNEEAYEAIRDAGLRTELLLSLLSQKSAILNTPSTLILRAHDPTASGDTDVFLSSKLEFKNLESGQEVCTVMSNGQEVGVMMGWEREIMEKTVHELCDSHPRLNEGLKILNIGFGLGIIDTFFQSLPTPPALHVIIEAHPDVLSHISSSSWDRKPNVHVLPGKWQDLLSSHPTILESGGFDVIYTDTFSEDYSELQAFFEEVPSLLSGPDARFGFFHGLGATNALFYDVYTKLSEVHLAQLGMDVSWVDVRVAKEEGEEERWGETRRYFTVPWYRMPVARMSVPDGEEEEEGDA